MKEQLTLSVQAVLLWIIVLCYSCESRHVPLASQTRPRLLVIRPPPGSNQPNRVIVLTNPRLLQSEAGTSRSDTTRPLSPSAIPGLSSAPESPPPTEPPADDVGGHPQSRARQQERPQGGSRSLRTLLEALNNQRKSRKEVSNIARVSDTIPRAMPPMLPTENRFGDLNIPRVIEAALKRARKQARMMGNVRPVISGSPHDHSMDTLGEGGALHNDFPDLSMHNSAKSRQFSAVKDTAKGTNNKSSSTFTGSGLRSFAKGADMRSGRRTGHAHKHRSMHEGLAPTGLSSHANHHHIGHAGRGDALHVHTGLDKSTMDPVSNRNNVKNISNTNSNSSPKNAHITQILSKESLSPINSTTGNFPSKPAKSSSGSPEVASLSANATIQLDASSANSTTNTTSTKTVKTKKIKVTTVVKGGTAADVAAAAASQAEIANAVSQGKEINSTSIAEIAQAAAKKLVKESHPAGSITVKRQNGISVITLSDGIGEPVVIRATGPVKIERIVKPDGKVQFVVNPVVEKSTNPSTTSASSAEKEVEPEDMPVVTTTYPTTTFQDMLIPEFPFIAETSSPPPSEISKVSAVKSTKSVAENPAKTITAETHQGQNSNSKPDKIISKANDIQKTANKFSPFDIFKTPRIPRPPPTIPRPPRVPDMMFGNQGLIDPLAASLMVGSGEMFPLLFSQTSTEAPIQPARPIIDGQAQQPSASSNIRSITSATDIMPHYDIVKKASSKEFTVR